MSTSRDEPEQPDPASSSGEIDTTSDPARNDDEGSDWADEGGATPEGPATDVRGKGHDPLEADPARRGD